MDTKASGASCILQTRVVARCTRFNVVLRPSPQELLSVDRLLTPWLIVVWHSPWCKCLIAVWCWALYSAVIVAAQCHGNIA